MAIIPTASLPLISNLVGLPSGAPTGSRIIGLGSLGSTNVDMQKCNIGPIKIVSGGNVPGSPNGTGFATLLIGFSEDGVLWTDAMDPTSSDSLAQTTLFLAGQSLQRNKIQDLTIRQSNTAYYFDGCSLIQQLGYAPTFCALFVLNRSGAPFAATMGSPPNFAGTVTIVTN